MVAADLARYFTVASGDSTPVERGDATRSLCESLCALLELLLRDEAAWDSGFTWLDGILPASITQMPSSGLRIVGGAIVVNGNSWTLQAVEADLAASAPQAPATSTIRFAGSDSEVPFKSGAELSLDAPRGDWRYVYQVRLPPSNRR